MSTINYSDKIPNNVNLSRDKTLQRALEHQNRQKRRKARQGSPCALQPCLAGHEWQQLRRNRVRYRFGHGVRLGVEYGARLTGGSV